MYSLFGGIGLMCFTYIIYKLASSLVQFLFFSFDLNPSFI